MIATSEQFSNRRPTPEPLPADMPPELAAIDMKIAELTKRECSPAGLTQSVFARSRAFLPQPHTAPQPSRAASNAWTLPVPRLLRANLRGRLAMAASLGGAFVLAALFMRTPASPTEAPVFFRTVAWHLEQLEQAPLDDPSREVTSLQEALELSNLEEVVGPIWAGLETM